MWPCFLPLDGAAALFRWSADGKYLARKGKDLISIYELPSMRLLDKKSLKVTGSQGFWGRGQSMSCAEGILPFNPFVNR